MKAIQPESCVLSLLSIIAVIIILASLSVAIASISIVVPFKTSQFDTFIYKTNNEQCGQWVFMYDEAKALYEVICDYVDVASNGRCSDLYSYVKIVQDFIDHCTWIWDE